jgi:hypothetical protein
MIVLLIVGSFIMAAICGAIAHSNGRSVTGYWLLGMFLGPIGLIAVLAAGKKR